MDPEKPRCPYDTRFQVEITRHLPPAPFGDRPYGHGDWPTDATWDWLRSVTQTKHILRYPPLESKFKAPASLVSQKAKLAITKVLAVEDGRGPQVVVCSISPHGAGSKDVSYTAVAKIFDPLYYSFSNKSVSDQPVDVAYLADGDYSREAAAYEHLQATGQTGSFAPGFYGSWTFTLPITHGGVLRHRPVRLLLIEYLDGACLRDLCRDPRTLTFDREYRLAVLAKIADGYTRQYHKGVFQDDLAARNIILVPRPQSTTKPQPVPRVVLIDYNCATVFDRSIGGRDPSTITKLPPSPLDWFWGETMSEFDGWRPEEWDSNPRAVQEWLLREFWNKNRALYEPPKVKLELSPPSRGA